MSKPTAKPDDQPQPKGGTGVSPVEGAEHGQDARATPKKRRRWLRYSLRTFLLLVTVFAVWLGLLVHRVNKQKAAVQWVRERGGTVYYDFQVSDDAPVISADAEPPGPEWLRELIGIDYFAAPSAIILTHSPISELGPIGDLAELEYVALYYTRIQDISPLRNLRKLRRLSLTFTNVHDLRPLSQLHHLEDLELACTKVSDLGALRDLVELQLLDLAGTPVSDIAPLRNLTKLGHLDLRRTDVRDLTPLRWLPDVGIHINADQDVVLPPELESRATIYTIPKSD